MLLYVGPDQVVPAMSVLATVMGFIMIFWNKLTGIIRKVFGFSKPVAPAGETLKGEETQKTL